MTLRRTNLNQGYLGCTTLHLQMLSLVGCYPLCILAFLNQVLTDQVTKFTRGR